MAYDPEIVLSGDRPSVLLDLSRPTLQLGPDAPELILNQPSTTLALLSPPLSLVLDSPPAPSLSGGSGSQVVDVILTSGETISGHKVVVATTDGHALIADTTVYAADPLFMPVGVALNSATVGNPVTVRARGVLVEPSWSWTRGPLYLGSAGQLTQTPPNTGPVVRMGVALNPTTVLVEPEMVARAA